MTAGIWVAFGLAGGVYGALLYLLLVMGVPFLMNAITYIQHWGLGDDGPGGDQPLGDDQCSTTAAMCSAARPPPERAA